MQSLQAKASEWSGVDSADAFAIDDTNLFQKLGLQTFINLSTNFYTRVYDVEEEWFRSIFANSKKEDAIQNQYEFFVQRLSSLFAEERPSCFDCTSPAISCNTSKLLRGGCITCNMHWTAPRILMQTQKSRCLIFSGTRHSSLWLEMS